MLELLSHPELEMFLELDYDPDENPARWNCLMELHAWMSAFRTFFPRKAHLAERAAARLCGFDSFETLMDEMPEGFHGLDDPDADNVHALRRLINFEADRLILIHEFRILPDAADYFLTVCPVGAADLAFQMRRRTALDESLCYYGDDQSPSHNVPAIIQGQYDEALGMCSGHPATDTRLGEFPHPATIHGMLGYLGLNFVQDFAGNDGLDDFLPASRVGWINCPELGSVECISLPFTVYPNWGRDEVFRDVCVALSKTRKLGDKPVLILNKHPLQLVVSGNAYTSLGYVLFERRIEPFFVSPNKISLADLIVESATFDPEHSTSLADTGSQALSVYWSLLTQHSDERLPASPRFRKSPDNWMLPNWK